MKKRRILTPPRRLMEESCLGGSALRRSSLPVRIVATILLGLIALACSPDRNTRQFDLPAGHADQTLLEFAKQGEVEIVYDSDTVAMICTRKVEGRFSPSRALRLMLAGTGLVAERDSRTEAFAVIRQREPGSEQTVGWPALRGLTGWAAGSNVLWSLAKNM